MSTAADLLKVAGLDMANPTVTAIVRNTSVTLPLAGTLSTYTPLIGLQGIIGVKSGYTVAAGGCDVLAVVRTVHGRPVLLLAAVTGQTGVAVLAQAGLHGLALVDAMAPLIGTTPVVHEGQLAAHVRSAGRTVDARTAASASVLTWPGVKATPVFRPVHHLTRPGAAGCPCRHRRGDARAPARRGAGAAAAGHAPCVAVPAPLLTAGSLTACVPGPQPPRRTWARVSTPWRLLSTAT